MNSNQEASIWDKMTVSRKDIAELGQYSGFSIEIQYLGFSISDSEFRTMNSIYEDSVWDEMTVKS